ncbi:Ste24 endopeptidase [Desulfobulbus propionicus DSM 2032]|uniref:Ste24 endopeptidase n=1 Tax=Desulfobulbus propionicus (strain ATCC 33891 / DSM 2032 / VKM B-1956 / 1pr3) TaxID=577650 RepID=A0A7U3YIY6_DESPD|nr:M48 family metallopeptidase [Desulfobulbus propionicus]ADW16258.1 Ste24 endopeptidase [Desulfobulbus propionicus DSM 2032]
MALNGYLLFIVSILVLGYLLELTVALLNLRSLSPRLPAEFAGVYDAVQYARSQEYTRATTRFSLVRATVSLILTLLFILAGGFNGVDLLARGFGLPSIPTGLLFTGLLALLSAVLSLPFSVYSTFVIEQRFGFNTTTPATFVLDLFKGLGLAVALGGPLLAVIFWLFEASGPRAWLYCWAASVAFVLVVQVLAPVVILPLFNKFAPLAEGELKEAITRYAASQRFALQGIHTMDGSKRSTRANAFFTGFGRFRRIVFFDTLMDKLSTAEIVAVLAHEMGHYKLKHIPVMLALSILQMGLLFFILSLFLNNQGLFAAFGMEHVSVYASLVFFGFLYAPISTLMAIGFNIVSRQNEYQADRFAARTLDHGAESLISGLKKLSVSNLSNLTPHPLHVMLNSSHPPVLARIEALRRLQTGQVDG